MHCEVIMNSSLKAAVHVIIRNENAFCQENEDSFNNLFMRQRAYVEILSTREFWRAL